MKYVYYFFSIFHKIEKMIVRAGHFGTIAFTHSTFVQKSQILPTLYLFFFARITNLELMLDYGCEAWKDYNDVLQDMVNKLSNR